MEKKEETERIILQKGVKSPPCFSKKEEVQVTFKCYGAPIGDVGTYTGDTMFTVLYAKTISKVCEHNRIKTTEEEWNISVEDNKKIMEAFSPLDFDPDDSEDLVVSGLECNGTWSAIKTICVYEKNISDERDDYEFYQ
ncbi:hypothetical protein IIV31_027L [Armadillidium vulgare iridescent virus]|uniref:Uncharacterized protein n=1 Tax=Armadillidium vulgare iridescent virus TaxID=72201 RepID=A0A068QLN7_9VIRU|nr:hypothetical protein IIV31_027L [Armadillidium vulgare iridescent virus]CCV02399.1 hypothetical protein IIV31_027L [Armadillidium vulgare iridescent virus]